VVTASFIFFPLWTFLSHCMAHLGQTPTREDDFCGRLHPSGNTIWLWLQEIGKLFRPLDDALLRGLKIHYAFLMEATGYETD